MLKSKLRSLILLLALAAAPTECAPDKGVVSASVHDMTFLIETSAGQKTFEAKGLCFNVKEGDRVIFHESPAACVSNTFTNPATGDTCRVLCR